MKKPGTRTYSPEKTRAAIITKALALFESPGYNGASVGDIAEAAGITKGAFYYHFTSKEELLRSDQPHEQLRHLIESMVEGVIKYRSHVTVFFQERRHLGKQRLSRIGRKRKVMARTLADVLERGKASGVFRKDLDTRVTALGIVGMCAWSYQWFSASGPMSGRDVAGVFTDIALNGVRS